MSNNKKYLFFLIVIKSVSVILLTIHEDRLEIFTDGAIKDHYING